MGCTALSLLFTIFFIGTAYAGTDCSYGAATNIFHKFAKTCPIPVVHASDAVYCCEGGCCTLGGYLFSGYRLIIIIVVTVIIAGIAGVTRCCTNCRNPGIFNPFQKQVTTAHPLQTVHPVGNTGYRGPHN